MNDKFTTLLMRHLTLLDSGETASKLIFEAACRSDIDLVHFEMGNRDRIVRLIELFQSNIDEFISELDPKEDLKEINEVVKTWANDLNLWVNRIDMLDLKTSEILESHKHEVTKEISSVFKNAADLKGYNLNNVTK